MKETIDRKSLKDYKGSRYGNFLKKFGNHCFRGCNIEKASSIKLLGVIVNEHLSWKEHIMLIYKKLRQIFCVIVKIKPNLNEKTLLMLYHSLLMSNICYCISSWCFGNETLIDKL